MKALIELKADEENIRLDKYLGNALKDYTRSFLQKQIDEGNITVNGKVQPAKYKVKQDDCICIQIPEAVETTILPEPIPIEIVYEDMDLLVVNKPQDMVVHPAPGHYTGTLVNALLYHCKDSLSGINGEIRPGIVHRIDKDTSGLLMIAKNDQTHLALSNKLKDHDIIRRYHAIVYGRFKEQEGIIEQPIGRCPKDRKKMAIVPDGRYAKTFYRVIEQFKDCAYVELTLYTGRTHQIRVHMASIGHPLLGDPIYTTKKHLFGLNQQVLHAKVLGFVHPRTQEEMFFESELPDYFVKLIDKLRKM